MRPEVPATFPANSLAVPELVESLLNRAERVIVGQRDNMEMVLLALICGGHILLEGVPGTAKTLTLEPSPGSCKLIVSASNSRRI